MKKTYININMVVIFLYILSIFTIQGCSSTFNKDEYFNCNCLTGDWFSLFRNNIRVCFTKDTIHYEIKLSDNWESFIREKFSCENLNSSLLLTTKSGMRYRFQFLDNDFVVFNNYKDSKGIEDHIDEILVLCKDSSKRKYQIIKGIGNHDEFIMPSKIGGVYAIAFNHDDGKNVVYNDSGNRLFMFTDSTPFIKTKACESVSNIAFNNIKFLLSDSTDNLIELPSVVLTKAFLESDTSNNDKLYVFIMGFNQISRQTINKLFNQPIKGNVAFFKVATKRKMTSMFLGLNDSLLIDGKMHPLIQD